MAKKIKPNNYIRKDQGHHYRKGAKCNTHVDPDGPLSDFEVQFVGIYMQKLNTTRSYLALKPDVAYSTAACEGSKLLAKPNVRKYIDSQIAAIRERHQVSRDRIIEELANCAFLDPADLYNENGSLMRIGDMAPHVRAAIQGIDTEELHEEGGNVGQTKKLRLIPKEKALQLLAQYIGADRPDKPPEPGDPGTMTHFHTTIPFDKIRERAKK